MNSETKIKFLTVISESRKGKTMTYDYALEAKDFARIDKLNALTDSETFYADVRKLCRNVKSDHAIHRWQCLADARFAELNSESNQ